MKKALFGLGLAMALAAIVLFGAKLAYALTFSQGTITYYTGYTPTFSRSTTPYTTGVTTQSDNPDGSVTVNVIRADGYADSGFVIYDGRLGDLSDFTLTGTGDAYGLNIWFDKDSDSEYFNWAGNVLTNLGSDTYALGPGSSAGNLSVTGSSQFYLMSNGTTYTLSDLKAGLASGITADTHIAIWVGVTVPDGGSKSATINMEPLATPTPTPVPSSLACPEGLHVDLSGTKCLAYEFGGPPAPPPANTQVLGASTTAGQVLGASTMAGTGGFEQNLYAAIMGIGGTLSTLGFVLLKKASKLA